jgi:hypothetical protein
MRVVMSACSMFVPMRRNWKPTSRLMLLVSTL